MMKIKAKLNCKKLLLIQSLNIFHCVEEYFFGFSNWATRHFGTTSQNWYLLSHIIAVAILGIIIFCLYKGFKIGVFFAFAVQVLIFTNGLFHILTSILWLEYSPGAVSQILIIPITYFVYKMISKSHILSQREILYSAILGCIVSVFLILSLFINIPI